MRIKSIIITFILLTAISMGYSNDTTSSSAIDFLSVALDTVWVLLAAFLVFFMNLGFAMVESGLCRAKNAVNILSKNFIVFAISTISFWVIGFGLMFGDGNDFIGLKGLLLLSGPDTSPLTGEFYKGVYSSLSWAKVPLLAKFMFQLAFAGTAATIVSGVVAERIKFLSFILFSFILVGFIYPIIGHWIWGGGWLAKLGFYDFAGSTVVHSVGGWAGLMGVLLLGPRIGKYANDGTPKPIFGHNLSLVTLGGLVLWFGWFGFNPGSTMSVGDGSAIAHITVNTNLAAAMAILSSTITSWLVQKKPDLTMIINGALAGLVAITAPCAFVTTEAAAIIGLIAGILVVLSVLLWDRLHIDDPVGALSVHLVNGVFGTISIGLFAKDGITGTATGNGLFYGGGLRLLGVQLLGVITVGLFVAITTFITWYIIKLIFGLRVSREEEIKGLDIGEHALEAYSGFQILN